MAARCFGFSIVLWCFWAAFVALMRVRDCPETNAQANCLPASVLLSRRGPAAAVLAAQKRNWRNRPGCLVCVDTLASIPRPYHKKPHTSFLRRA